MEFVVFDLNGQLCPHWTTNVLPMVVEVIVVQKDLKWQVRN